MRPENFLRGQRCPFCRKNFPYTLETISEKIKNTDPEYIVTGKEYHGVHSKLLLKHIICNKEFETRPEDFINGGHRCPYCKTISKGENKLREILDSQNILYKEQYTYSDLRSAKNRMLKFDFAILNSDLSVKLLIEFDGSHHYHNYGLPERFADIKDRDSRKDEYVKTNNIPFLRIPYWKDIKTELVKYSIICPTTNPILDVESINDLKNNNDEKS